MTKQDLSSFNNSEFQIGRNILIRVLWYLANAIFFKSYLFPFSALKVGLLKLFGAKVGKGVVIKPNVNIKYPWKLSIGSYVWIGEEVWLDNLDQITIKDNVCISQGAFLLCGNHSFMEITFDLITKPIEIAEGAWIGAKSIVCPGAIVEEGTVLTVGSVLKGVTVANSIYSGNPAVKIKDR